MKKESRSSKYQYLFNELVWDHDTLDFLATLYGPVWDQHDDMLLMLRDKLAERITSIANKILTKRQHECCFMWFGGMTQAEIAHKLKIHQSSIAKAIWGNQDNITKKFYGGAIRKIRNAMLLDEKCIDILSQINDINDENGRV